MRKAPNFWWRRRIGLRAALLWPIALVYARAARRRMCQPPAGRARTPVVCIGNFVAGGAGKTPTAIALAKILREDGRKPYILTRGYGGRFTGPLLVDADRHRAADVGDEALLLTEGAPTIVAVDRVAGARAASDAGADIILLDDGFQNPALARDLSIVVADGKVGIGNGLTIPAGPLRAPLATQLERAGALLVIGEGQAGARLVRLAARGALPVLHARLESRPNPEIAGKRVLAFAGIGRPQKFFDSLRTLDAEIVETRSFPDHHVYTAAQAQEILTIAEKRALVPVTTAKDMRRIEGMDSELLRWLASSARVLEVDLVLAEEGRMLGLLHRAMREHAFH